MAVNGFQNWHSIRNVWYENAVHDVNMKPIGFTVVDHFDVALQISKSAASTDGAISVFFIV
jgi:hypothetical protein